jgi:hypothetical protein
MMKSVPNFIFYPHEFSQFFTHFVPIFLVWKGDFQGFLKLEKSLTRGACLSAALPLCHARVGWSGQHCRRAHGLKAPP